MRTVAALVLASAGVLAGCGGLNIQAPAVVGPLFDASKPTTFCLSAARGHPVAVGWDLLQEGTGSPVATIRSVELADPSGLRLVGVLAVPVHSDQVLGNGWDYPLSARQVGEISHGVDWGRRRPAVGAKVAPGGSESGTNLVVGVATTGAAAGSARGLTVTYVAAGHRFVLTLPTSFTVDNQPARC